MRFASSGDKLPPKKIVFHFTNPPVDQRLIDWLQERNVEVRQGQR